MHPFDTQVQQAALAHEISFAIYAVHTWNGWLGRVGKMQPWLGFPGEGYPGEGGATANRSHVMAPLLALPSHHASHARWSQRRRALEAREVWGVLEAWEAWEVRGVLEAREYGECWKRGNSRTDGDRRRALPSAPQQDKCTAQLHARCSILKSIPAAQRRGGILKLSRVVVCCCYRLHPP